MKKRFYKYYHPRNRHFFVHIVVDAILITAVASVLACTLYLAAHPAGNPFTSGYVAMPATGRPAKISAEPSSENIAKKKILRELKLFAVCRYALAEGDQLGIGPLPPKAGETTKYWIFLSPSTDYFDVEDITVTAELAENASFTGRTSSVSETGVVYDEASRRISWKISRLENSEDLLPPGAAFEIAFAPAEGQIGQTAKLLINIKISGSDAPTKTALETTVSDLTTRIKEDLSGGVIQP